VKRGLVAVLIACAPLAMAGARPASAQATLDAEPECGQETGAAGTTVADAPAVRVGTFNVLHSQSDVGDETLEARVPLIVAALAGARIDVAGLQEVAKTTNHGHVAQRIAQGLAALRGGTWSWCWFQSNPHFPGEPDLQPGGGGGPLTEVMASAARAGDTRFAEGVAVVSRFAIEDATVRRLPPRSYESPLCVPPDPIDCNAAAFFDSRAVLRARIAGPTGPLDLFTTHLAHGLTPLSDTTKLLYANLALAYADELAVDDATPDLLVGDFNSTEDSAVHQAVIDAGFVDTFRLANPTDLGHTSDQDPLAPAATVTSRIDYVFARPGGCGLRAGASEILGNRPAVHQGGSLWPSDHFGLVSELSCSQVAGTGVATDNRAAAPATGRLAATGAPLPLATALAALFAFLALRRLHRVPQHD
jgi:endonuclease/exonuclease/phosphatase family metal-dependent hydrolase